MIIPCPHHRQIEPCTRRTFYSDWNRFKIKNEIWYLSIILASMEYLCVTADIVDSRNSANEKHLSELKQKLGLLNQELSPLVPLSLNAGDEIQGLWAATASLPKIQMLMYALLMPLKISIGFGLGSITGDLQSHTREMRGDVFILARQALDQAKKKSTNVCFKPFEGSHSNKNIILLLLASLTKKWNSQTYRRFLLYREAGNIYSVAEQEQVSPEAINKFINRHDIRTVLKVMDEYVH